MQRLTLHPGSHVSLSSDRNPIYALKELRACLEAVFRMKRRAMRERRATLAAAAEPAERDIDETISCERAPRQPASAPA